MFLDGRYHVVRGKIDHEELSMLTDYAQGWIALNEIAKTDDPAPPQKGKSVDFWQGWLDAAKVHAEIRERVALQFKAMAS